MEIPQINRRRAMRALEIAHFGQDLENQAPAYEPYIICLDDDRQALYDRINRRVDLMVEQGLLEEAQWLYDKRVTSIDEMTNLSKANRTLLAERYTGRAYGSRDEPALEGRHAQVPLRCLHGWSRRSCLYPR